MKANGPGSSVRPLREILKEFAKEADGFSDEDDQSFAKQCLLSKDDVKCGSQTFKGVERMLRRRISRRQPGKPRRGRQTGMNKRKMVSFSCANFFLYIMFEGTLTAFCFLIEEAD